MSQIQLVKDKAVSAYKFATDTNEGQGTPEKIAKRKLLALLLACLWCIAMVFMIGNAIGATAPLSYIASLVFLALIGLAFTFIYNTITFRPKADLEEGDLWQRFYIIPMAGGLFHFLLWYSGAYTNLLLYIGTPIILLITLVLYISVRTKHLSTEDTATKTYSWRNGKVRYVYNNVTLFFLTLIAILLGAWAIIPFACAMFTMMYCYDRETREDFFFYRLSSPHSRGLRRGFLVGVGILLFFGLIDHVNSIEQKARQAQISEQIGIENSPTIEDAYKELMYTFKPKTFSLHLWSIAFGFLPNLIIGVITYVWMAGVRKYMLESYRHGTARVMRPEELTAYQANGQAQGTYIGGGEYHYTKRGHTITVAGTRAGKGTNLIIPHLLGATDYDGSLVILDPKGENTAITGIYQASRRDKDGNPRSVKILDPFRQLEKLKDLHPGDKRFAHLDQLQKHIVGFNPMDILKSNIDPREIPDDAQMLAQMIVPEMPGGSKEDYFNDQARTMITGILTHLTTKESNPNLNTLWDILRAESKKPSAEQLKEAKTKEDIRKLYGEWETFITDMVNNKAFDGIISKTGHAIGSLEANSNREAASVKSTARKWTDFLKSPLLRPGLQSHTSNFNPNTLSEGNTTLYVVIPADKLESHGAWLRLVIGACMKSVIRKPKKDVQFILDEFYTLGNMPMVETAMGAYSGYGVRVWAIIQSLNQLRKLYGESGWENFIGNATVMHAFGINDNFSAEYISKMTGETSFPSYSQLWGFPTGATPRNVHTAAEVRELKEEILLFVDRKSVARLHFKEYWKTDLWQHKTNWDKRYRANPLHIED